MKILIIIIIIISLFSCNKKPENEKSITPIVNVSDFSLKHEQFSISHTVSTCWITPEEGVSSVRLLNPQNKRYTSSIIRRTTDAGKSWVLCKKFEYIARNIQYYNGALYAYLNKESIPYEIGVNYPSWVIISKDHGCTWQKLHKFEHNISNFIVVDSVTMIAVRELNLGQTVDNHSSSHHIIISHDEGNSWKVIDKLPSISTSPMPIYKVGNELYFKTAKLEEDKYLHSFNFQTGEYSRQKVARNYKGFYTYGVVDSLLILPSNGIYTFKMRKDSLEYISNYVWGWRAGSYHINYLAKDNKYIFVYSSRFPGNHGINRALHFSSNNGKSWKALVFAPKEVNLPYYSSSWSSFTNDSIFQVSAINRDTTRIYRVNKNLYDI